MTKSKSKPATPKRVVAKKPAAKVGSLKTDDQYNAPTPASKRAAAKKPAATAGLAKPPDARPVVPAEVASGLVLITARRTCPPCIALEKQLAKIPVAKKKAFEVRDMDAPQPQAVMVWADALVAGTPAVVDTTANTQIALGLPACLAMLKL